MSVFAQQGSFEGVRWGLTSRHGGMSGPPWASLNLGGHVGDDPAAVEDNRARVAAEVGVERDHLLFMEQCHGNDVAVVQGPWAGPVARVDGLVTSTPGLALAVLVADCVPVLLADAAAGVVAAVHAGRPGLLAGVVPRAVEAMREQGAGRLSAVVGPSVCGRCYEVPAAMRQEAADVVPEAVTVSWTGTPAIDVAAGVVAQLAAHEVEVQWQRGCTRESPDLFSYRGEGVTGRLAGVVVLS